MTTNRNIDFPSACIWTDAGVLRDRLCDRSFACESCPLDAALRKAEGETRENANDLTFETIAVSIPEGVASIPGPVVQPFLRMTLCNECRYSPNHIWIRRDYSSQYWCGLDSFAASLLPQDAQVVGVARGTHLEQGDPCAWIYAADLVLPVPSPIRGTLTSRRYDSTISAKGIISDPYVAGALVAILPDNGAMQESGTRSALEQASHLRHDARRLLSGLTRGLRQHDLETGVCLNDGGEAVSHIRELLGGKAWSALVKSFLCHD